MTGIALTMADANVQGSPSRRRLTWSLVFIGLLVAVALAAPLVAPFGPGDAVDGVAMKSQPPSADHYFGTDANSRDVYSRVIYGARVSLTVSSLSVLFALTIGVSFGALAALGGSIVERIMMRALDVLLALPRLLILLAITAFWDGLSILAMALVLGATGWYDIARLVHGESRTLLSRDYILAASASGVGRMRIFVRHMLPHLVPLLIVSATLGIASTISLEAGLSYLGLGLREPDVSWGMIMHDGLRVIDTQWWLTIFPGLAALIAVIACNALGEALRDHFARRQVHA